MNMNMGMNPMMNMGMGGYQPMVQPMFKQYAVGQGIDQREYNSIITAAQNAYMARASPLSTGTSNNIKAYLGGEWFVFVSPVGSKNFDFCLSCVTGGDFMSFSLDNTLFQICRLRN